MGLECHTPSAPVLLETNVFQGCISIPPHLCFSNGKALWRFISSSQLPNSPKFRALSTRSNLWLWFILQQVHPGMLKQKLLLLLLSHSIGNGNAAATLTTSHPQHHSPKHISTTGICSIREGSNRAMSQPCTSQCAGMLQPPSSSSVNLQGSFQGTQSHKQLCRFTGPRLCPAVFLSLWLFTYSAPSSQAPCLIAVLYPSSESPPGPALPRALHRRSRFSRALHPCEKQRPHPQCSQG